MDYAIVAAVFSSVLLGFSKAGFKGLSFIFVPLMAFAYGGKASTGIMLPLLMIGDCIAVFYYQKDVNWKVLIQLFIPMAVGVIIGTYVGDQIPVKTFKQVMAIIIILSGFIVAWLMYWKTSKIPDNKAFAIFMGLGAGFCTMVGNLAGAFSNIYFLAMQFPKREFIGTAAWLFFFINIFKLPFHIWVWKTINFSTIQTNLLLGPFVVIGFFIGLQLINRISNTVFQRYVLVMTLLGAVLILL